MVGYLAIVCLTSIARLALGLRTRDAGLETTVPFYMYELPAWAENCTEAWMAHTNYYPDVAFYAIMKDHPWRVTRASDAKLFVVPGYFGLSLAGACGSHKENMQKVADMLGKSRSFLRNEGRDHLISAFYWKATPVRLSPIEHLDNIIALRAEDHECVDRRRLGSQQGKRKRARDRPFGRPLAVPYGSVATSGIAARPTRSSEKNRTLFFMGQADNRFPYRTRRRALHLLPAAWNDSALVRTGMLPEKMVKAPQDTWDDPANLKVDLPPCDYPRAVAGCWMERAYEEYVALGQQSRYGLIIHGDFPSTGRMYDSFYFDQVPIVISDGYRECATPFADDLPWDDFAVFADQDAFAKDAPGTIEQALAEASKSTRLETMRRVRPALDWTLLSHCMGTSVLVAAARRYLNMTNLPRPLDTPECEASAAANAALSRMVRSPIPADVDKTLLEEIVMDGRFD